MSEHKQGGFLDRMKNSHYLMMLACLAPILILSVGSYFFGWKNGNLLTISLLAACFISHMFMMKNHKH